MDGFGSGIVDVHCGKMDGFDSEIVEMGDMKMYVC